MEPASNLISKEVTICVLCYGDFPDLARRCIDSILVNCDAARYELRVGLNECSQETIDYLLSVTSLDSLYLCRRNINQCPMMARMLHRIDTPYVWWFDDDSYIKHSDALDYRLRVARECPITVSLWGEMVFHSTTSEFVDEAQVQAWASRQSWYRDHPVPCGKEKLQPDYYLSGERAWHFCTGGSWFARTAAIDALDWPSRSLIKMSNDVFMSEAMRQMGYEIMHIGPAGVLTSDATRRGDGEDSQTMIKQLRG